MDRIRIAGLGEAVQRAATIDAPRQFVVTSVTVRQAGALLTLLESQMRERGWSVDRLGRLRKVHKVDSLLSVVAEAIVPALSNDPRDARVGRELRRYGASIARLARSVGGASLHSFEELGHWLRRNALDVDWVSENLDEVLAKVQALKNANVDFPDGDDEEEDEEEEDDEDDDDDEDD